MAINIRITVFWVYCHVDTKSGGSRLLHNIGNVSIQLSKLPILDDCHRKNSSPREMLCYR